MATLTRLRVSQNSGLHELEASIPSPFPMEVLQHERRQQRNSGTDGMHTVPPPALAIDTQSQALSSEELETSSDALEVDFEASAPQEMTNELLSSLSYVQHSCLMTLNNLICGTNASSEWQPILPTRRHSMPSPGPSSNQPESASPALQTLLSNLRSNSTSQMSEASSSTSDDAALLHEIQRRVQAISSELSLADAHLAQTITSFLTHVHRLTSIDSTLSGASNTFSSSAAIFTRSHMDIYDELSRQVMDLQIRRLDRDAKTSSSSSSPQRTVEIALLWSKMDHELETVFDLCRQREERYLQPYSTEQLPPEYSDLDSHSQLPPHYDDFSASYTDHKEKATAQSPITSTNEKMKMDLEAVTMAIDRLYLVAPQLHNQRVELKKAKLEELERAKLASPSEKGKEKDVRELERIIDMIGRASSRRLDDQSVTLVGNMESRVAKARERDLEKRDAFVDQLVTHSTARRITSQEAIRTSERTRNADALLTLPEFIREDVPLELCQKLDPDTVLSLPDFIKEEPPKKPTSPQLIASKKKSQKLKQRSRSYSAPPLAWLFPSLGRPASPLCSSPSIDSTATRNGKRMVVRYVAEHHENLHHVLVFLGVDEGMTPGVDLEAEVIPLAADHPTGDKLMLRCGQTVSVPLNLPVQVVAGKKEVHVQGGHYEVKLQTNLTVQESAALAAEDDNADLLDATHLKAIDPTSFICSSCSLVVVQSSNTDGGRLVYRDLPSEYWSELLEAWMCHSDQKLHSHITKHTNEGLWPQPDQVLVGGSYILFNDSSVVKSNVRVLGLDQEGEEWSRIQCICGAVLGRHRRGSVDGPSSGPRTPVYRMAKYALRPVSPTSEPCRTPFSAFILEDMMELVHAHASYRFVIIDEEEDRPRLLIWLFKPKIRLAYATTAQFALPSTGSVSAAKVLFKILGPETSFNADLDDLLAKYPGFPQAEQLKYPINICHRLAALLKESNTSYPMGMRVMTGLLVGWLLRS